MKENGEIKKMRKCGKEKNRKTATTWQGTIHGSKGGKTKRVNM